jgi:hypothetical protein
MEESVWTNLAHYSDILLEKLRQTTKNSFKIAVAGTRIKPGTSQIRSRRTKDSRDIPVDENIRRDIR